jgi:transcriptional regulator with XRE-family HTH domain
MPANFLKKIREEKKIGQSELAQKVGVSKQLISGFEKGRSGVSNEVLRKLAAQLDVSPDAIITGKHNKPFDEKGRKKLTEAMTLTFKFYDDQFDKETMVKIATELYGFMIDFDAAKKEVDRKKLKESLKEKITTGLAAKCLLDSKK